MTIEQEQYSLLYIQDMMCVLSRSQDICTYITRHVYTSIYFLVFSFWFFSPVMCSGYSVTSVSDGSSEFYVAGAPRAVHRGQVVVYSLNGQNQPVIIDSQRGDQVLVCLWSLMSFSFVTHWNHWGVWFADWLLFWQCSLSCWCGRWRCDGSAAGRSADVHERGEVWNRTSLPLHHYQGALLIFLPSLFCGCPPLPPVVSHTTAY